MSAVEEYDTISVGNLSCNVVGRFLRIRCFGTGSNDIDSCQAGVCEPVTAPDEREGGLCEKCWREFDPVRRYQWGV
jgi:hypothetical protein